MRIVIDLQGAQAENRIRGIGRYSLSLAKAMVQHKGEHQIIIALNGAFTDSIMPIREAFFGLLPPQQIRVWQAPGPVNQLNEQDDGLRRAAQLIREAFLASLKPDMVMVTSLFEGLVDDAVTSVGQLSSTIPTAVILYDLIPLINRKPYLDNPLVAKWYDNKLSHLQRADLLLSISQSSRAEGIKYLGFEVQKIINISTAVDSHFKVQQPDLSAKQQLQQRYGLSGNYVMYTGGIDHRKNIEGLIRAFAGLPSYLIDDHQLAIVCSIRDVDRQRLKKIAKSAGLNKNALILTGFVSEQDLLGLYDGCRVFVFPSHHEGFGLPALEAMSMGKAVIGANTSSVPEVIGNEQALFDPFDDDAITAKLQQVLIDDDFRLTLQQKGLAQAKTFSWEKTAQRAIAAIVNQVEKHQVTALNAQPTSRPRLAYVSPLPPSRSGISDYSAELLPQLSRHYDIDVIVVDHNADHHWNTANCGVRSIDWLMENGHCYDRVIYHFGNSAFHQHMFDLLQQLPGVVVLHDFFLSGIVAHMEVHAGQADYWAKALYDGHGYPALKHRFSAADTADVVFKYPCNFNVLQNARGIIVHSQYSKTLADHWYGHHSADDWFHVPLLRTPVFDIDKQRQRTVLGLDKGDFVVCSFGLLGATKLNHRLLDAWLDSSLAKDKRCKLVFVGENTPDVYGQALNKKISQSGLTKNILVTGWADSETFKQYLSAADVGVQLRTLSRGETSAAVLDCMNYGLATIVNANGSMADLDDQGVFKLADDFADTDLIDALQCLWQDNDLRHRLGSQAQHIIRSCHAPRHCATEYFIAVEDSYRQALSGQGVLLDKIADIKAIQQSPPSWIKLAQAVEQSIKPFRAQSQLLVDISELVQRDAKTGIQRVVRSILQQFFEQSTNGFRIEPVYATPDREGYFYARKFTLASMNCPETLLVDEPISYQSGDVFLGLDFQPQVVPAQQAFLQQLRCYGVTVKFVVYDLLCVTMPQYFNGGAEQGHSAWLEAVAQSDGVVCISAAVADDFSAWLSRSELALAQQLTVDWFHLGADFDKSQPTLGLPDNALEVIDFLGQQTTFISVGTVEPRKGYSQILAAFELLWQTGQAACFVIVGKVGWMVESFIDKLINHSQLNKQLFWFDGITDEYLQLLYNNSDCLIAASFGEGFGLPLIEAAQYRLPIMARDIPVFKEVAGQHAYYFSGRKPEELQSAIEQWLALYEDDSQPTSVDMPWLKWQESAQQLLRLVV